MLYKAQGAEEQFLALKPELTNRQSALLSAFYRLSQERRTEQGTPCPITTKDINYYISCYGACNYPADLFVNAIQEIDAEYRKLQLEELKRKNKGK